MSSSEITCFIALSTEARSHVMRKQFLEAPRDGVTQATLDSDPASEKRLCDRERCALSIGRIVSTSGNAQFSLHLPEMPITDPEAVAALGLAPDCVGTPPPPAPEQALQT